MPHTVHSPRQAHTCTFFGDDPDICYVHQWVVALLTPTLMLDFPVSLLWCNCLDSSIIVLWRICLDPSAPVSPGHLSIKLAWCATTCSIHVWKESLEFPVCFLYIYSHHVRMTWVIINDPKADIEGSHQTPGCSVDWRKHLEREKILTIHQLISKMSSSLFSVKSWKHMDFSILNKSSFVQYSVPFWIFATESGWNWPALNVPFGKGLNSAIRTTLDLHLQDEASLCRPSLPMTTDYQNPKNRQEWMQLGTSRLSPCERQHHVSQGLCCFTLFYWNKYSAVLYRRKFGYVSPFCVSFCSYRFSQLAISSPNLPFLFLWIHWPARSPSLPWVAVPLV